VKCNALIINNDGKIYKSKAVLLHAMKALGGRGGIPPTHSRLRHQIGRVISVMPRPRFTSGQSTPGTHWTGGWVSLRGGLDTEVRGKILCFCWELTSIARSSSPQSDTTLTELPQLWENHYLCSLQYKSCKVLTRKCICYVVWKYMYAAGLGEVNSLLFQIFKKQHVILKGLL
jgi:hypothetical protein